MEEEFFLIIITKKNKVKDKFPEIYKLPKEGT